MRRQMPGRRPFVVRIGACVAALALVAAACGDDDDDDAGGSPETTAASPGTSSTSGGSTETTAAPGDLLMPPTGPDLGPENVASGDPVKIGFFHDGTTAAVDHGDDTIVADALVEYWNEHQGGIGGRPVELVLCETRADPAIAADCGNQFVEEGVVFVATQASGFAPQVYPAVHAAGIPFIAAGVAFEELTRDGDTGFIVVNASAQSHGFPITIARENGLDNVTSLVIDVPGAVEPMNLVGYAAEAAGIEHTTVPITPGTPDMLPQVTAAISGGTDLVNLIFDPAGCLVALRALYEANFDGIIVTHDYCISAEAFEPLPPDRLQELVVSATVAMGDESDTDWQLYQAIMDEYADGEPEVSGVRGWTYQVLFMPLWALRDVEGEITPAVVTQVMNDLPEAHLPLGAGTTFRCDGSKFPPSPAFCTNQVLQTHLNADRQFEGYEAVDVSQELDAIAAGITAGG